MNHPGLKAEDLSQDAKLHGLIDGFLTADRQYWRRTRRILKLQLRHQGLASEDAFVAYLALEEAMNERTAWMLAAVARWAFDGWRRHVASR